MGNDKGHKSQLEETTFAQLFKEERLPSGHSFELMPDTVETALNVAEIDDILMWRKKAKQAAAVLKSVGGTNLQDSGEDDSGFRFVERMLDTDVVFSALAWSAQLNGMSIKLSEGVPCPSCAHPFREIPIGDVKVFARPAPIGDSGLPSTWPVEIDDEDLPAAIRGGTISVSDPTWKNARINVADRSWDNSEVVTIYRGVSCLWFTKKGKAPRNVQSRTEGRKIRAKAVQRAVEALDEHVPHFEPRIEMVCTSCKQVSVVPFDQGL